MTWTTAIVAGAMVVVLSGCGGGKSATVASSSSQQVTSLTSGSLVTTTTPRPSTTTTSSTLPPTTTTTPPTTTVPPTTTTIAPEQLAGTGSTVWIAWPLNMPGIVQYQHDGQTNFIVEGLDANNETTEIVVNALHDKTGTVPINFRDQGTVHFKVTARGGWAMTIQPLSAARQFDGNTQGENDDVDVPAAASLHVTATARATS